MTYRVAGLLIVGVGLGLGLTAAMQHRGAWLLVMSSFTAGFLVGTLAVFAVNSPPSRRPRFRTVRRRESPKKNQPRPPRERFPATWAPPR